MASRFSIETVFRATDMVSGTMRRMTRSVVRSGARMERAILGVAKASAKASAAVAAIGGVGFAGTAAIAAADTRAQQLAASLGVSVDLVEQLGASVEGAGFGFDEVGDLIEEMNNKLGESAALEEITPVAEALEILGLRFKDIKALSPEAQFRAIANAALQMEDAQQAASAADILMGSQANKLIGVLRQQGRTVDDVTGRFAALSTRTAASREGAAAFTRQLGVAKFGATSALRELSGLIAAELTPALESLVGWVRANRGEIQAFAAIAASALSELARTIGTGLVEGLRTLEASDIGGFLRRAAADAASLTGAADELLRVVHDTAATVSSFVQVGVIAVGVLAAYRTALIATTVATKGLAVAQAAWLAVTVGVPRVLALARAAMVAFNAVLLANPIGLAVAAISALIAAGALLITHWDDVVKFFVSSWDAIGDAFEAGLEMLRDIFAPIGALLGSLGDLINFDGMFDGMVESAEDALGRVTGMFKGVGDFFSFGGDDDDASDGDGAASQVVRGAAPRTVGEAVSSPQEEVTRMISETNSTAEVTLRNETNSTAEVTQHRGAPPTIINSGAF